MKGQWLLKLLLAITTLLEVSFGVYLLIRPGRIGEALKIPPDQIINILVSRMYGLAALCVGLLSLGLLVSRKETDFLPYCLVFFMIFHLGMFFVQLADSADPMATGAVHLILGIGFSIYFMMNKKRLSF